MLPHLFTSTNLIPKEATKLTTASARTTYILTNRDIADGIVSFLKVQDIAENWPVLQSAQETEGHANKQNQIQNHYCRQQSTTFKLQAPKPNMATPVKTTTIGGPPVTDSPGTWRHPRLNEIARRRNATTFSEKNVLQIAYNVVALVVFWFSQILAKLYIGSEV